MMPSLFIAHGSPTLAIEDNLYTQYLTALGKTLPKPKAIVLFSAHWVSPVQTVSNVDEFKMIYDFYGFPDEMYNIVYPAKGYKDLTIDIVDLFKEHGISFRVDETRGLDHGAWVVLRLLYPNADVPVISMSVNPNLSPEEQYKIGTSLFKLREKDVLIIGSGGTVHNLRALNWSKQSGDADGWAVEFDDWIGDHINKWDLDSLFKYDAIAPNAELAVPPYGNEHFVPIFYAMGAADNEKKAKLIHSSYQYGNLSHSVWQFG
ncbi:dioxygenase family protein [Schinkia azotoformans]|uniref:dioxygenase family protein n=1 Tax=Schinkia azotoformans TaxID=1454 RepID=UPI002DB6BC5B|nr:class III extradiol ring-cleavage dioxygenase [Schinkia azotoformans]MEC1721261.1 class III extradiol ring-cleavage dioxygenase [Schinkia azotoformans]MED4414408.1 class III extradiol ring-cleavage dioxygenase [Schinkia azotoformans]